MPRAKSSQINLTDAQAFVIRHLPGAAVAEKFGNASFSIAGKVFAFTRPDGLVLKLPQEDITHLLATREAKHLVMGKRVMREWALLPLPTRDSYVEEIPLLKLALAFVQSLEKR